MVAKPKTSISKASSYEEMGEFWDAHDFTEFDTNCPDVAFTITLADAEAVQLETYTALLKREDDWWIGWIEEIPGVNAQERTREELIASLEVALEEALEF